MGSSMGEYVCTATRNGTFKKGRASFFVKLQDEPGNLTMRGIFFLLAFHVAFARMGLSMFVVI